ncbi:hypothetical protein [Neobacillus sp. D3-1R]|uniref:hypothetical protein n=1 Tax=Neobacillus sp. D3-1R TaxID=3445778 RepID=UPI003F9F94E7
MIIIYEKSFDTNEWFIIISLIALNTLILITPKLFSFVEGLVYYLFGVFFVTFFDHTLSVIPWDYYDVNDNSKFQFMDLLSYIMNGPYAYFFVYLYSKLKIHDFTTIPYLVVWSGFSVLLEWVGLNIGLFHYDKGYSLRWSFPIYMTVQMILIFLHLKIKKSRNRAI